MKTISPFATLCALVLALGTIAGIGFAQATPAAAASAKLAHANQLAQDKSQPVLAVAAAFFAAIEADPEFRPAHEELRKYRNAVVYRAHKQKETKPDADAVNQAIEDQYAAWLKRWPDSIAINYAIGQRFESAEDPRAKPYLLKVVALDPKNASAWSMLWGDAERWGDKKGALEYIRRAAQAEPNNPDYAFYYAFSLQEESREKWEAASLDLARRFPESERGAQALYWLGQKSDEDEKRIRYFEQALRDFPAAKFSWTRAGADSLFGVYLRTAPGKAAVLAKEMIALGGEGAKAWVSRLEFAETFAQVKQLVDTRKFDEANALVDKLTVDRRASSPVTTLLLKAEVLAGAGNHQGAYDLLLQQFAAAPDDELRAGMLRQAEKLGKDAKAIATDTWALRDAAARPAPGFELGVYGSDEKVSLAGLRGKVVFVTFWFPGCGPCRAEFPHFENVLAKFKGNKDLVYLGINGIRQQDAYVVPFMQGTKYTFTPLKGEKTVNAPAPEGYGVKYYPMNFLIDRDGRIVFSNFGAHDEASERVLRRMIEALLARPARA